MVLFKAKYSFNFLGEEIVSELETTTLGQSFGFEVATDLLKKFKNTFTEPGDIEKFLDEFTPPVKFREQIKFSIMSNDKDISDRDIAMLITYPIAEYFMKGI